MCSRWLNKNVPKTTFGLKQKNFQGNEKVLMERILGNFFCLLCYSNKKNWNEIFVYKTKRKNAVLCLNYDYIINSSVIYCKTLIKVHKVGGEASDYGEGTLYEHRKGSKEKYKKRREKDEKRKTVRTQQKYLQ